MNYLEIEKKYNNEFNPDYFDDNIYSLINPIGKYDYYSTANMLSWYIDKIVSYGKNISDITLLDAGCGDGRKSRIMAELIGNSNHISGFELTEEGLNCCKRLNNLINYQYGDIVSEFPHYNDSFDGIICCCVFMFLRRDEEILSSLRNIKNNLKDDGLFLWFDANEKSHMLNPDNLYCGFSAKEMDKYTSEVGFEIVDKSYLFKNIEILNRRISTYYLVDKIGILNCELINKLFFLKPSFNARIYKKIM